jgi:hypothetical protein
MSGSVTNRFNKKAVTKVTACPPDLIRKGARLLNREVVGHVHKEPVTLLGVKVKDVMALVEGREEHPEAIRYHWVAKL